MSYKSMKLPTVDYQDWVSGDVTKRGNFVKEFGDSCRKHGFVTVKNHAIDIEDLNRYYAMTREFFALPVATKMKYAISDGGGQRGYTPFGIEHAKTSDQPDLKEFLQHGQPEGPRFGYPSNVPVSADMPGYDDLAEKLYRQYQQMSSELMVAVAHYLNFEPLFFEPYVKTGNSIFRTIYYPPIRQEPESAIRAEAHEDINLITLLVAGTEGGLQVKNLEDEWVSADLTDGQLTINVGDMLMRLTNGYLPSTTHRVLNPPKEDWHKDRISTPFFLHPVGDMDLTAHKDFVSEDNPPRFEPITADDYLNQRLQEIGLVKN